MTDSKALNEMEHCVIMSSTCKYCMRRNVPSAKLSQHSNGEHYIGGAVMVTSKQQRPDVIVLLCELQVGCQ